MARQLGSAVQRQARALGLRLVLIRHPQTGRFLYRIFEGENSARRLIAQALTLRDVREFLANYTPKTSPRPDPPPQEGY